MPMDPVKRRAALIATGITVPLVVTLVIVLAIVQAPSGAPAAVSQPTGSELPGVTPSAPPNDPAVAAACTALIGALPITLDDLAGRASRPNVSYETYTAAWGQPAVVLRCGVTRPKDLVADAQIFAVNQVNWLRDVGTSAELWTAVDRSVYIDVSIPTAYSGSLISPIATAIGKTLPQVCTAVQAGDPAPAAGTLCVNRK